MKRKPPHNSSRTSAALLGAMLAAFSATVAVSPLRAASGNWLGTTDATWAGANWSAATPGAGEAATFNGAGNGNTIIDLGAGVTVGSVIFDTASAAAYTIGTGGAGAQTLTFGDTGTVTMNSTVANNQVFDSNIILGTAVVGTTTITNLTTGVGAKNITINGTIMGGTGGTAGIKTITSSVLSGGSITYTNAITAGGSSGINFGTFQSANNDLTHTGTVILGGSATSSLRTLTATGGSSMTVAGQNVSVSTLSSYGATTTYGKFIISSGSVAFNGGIQSATSGGNPSGADGMAFIVNGGSFSAASVTLGRAINTGSTTTFFTTPFNMATSGFQVNGGTAAVTGAVRIAGSNSSATGQVTAGSLTIGGELALGETTTRNNLFQVTGGALTVTDTTNGGIVIGKGTAAAAAAGQLLLTGGTTTTEKISFGLNNGFAGSTGNLTLNGASANLYVGSGGIVKAATNAYTNAINLMNGTLGAKAGWSSSLPMSLAGAGVIIKAADASNVSNNISLSGPLSGANGFTKTGGGTLTLSGLNTYSNTTVISEGQLTANHISALGTGDVTISGGTLGSSVASVTGIGALTLSSGSLDLNSASVGSVVLAANKSFSLSGTGVWSVSLASTSSFDQVFGSGTGTFSLSGGSVTLGDSVPDYTASYALLSGFSSGSIGATSITGYDEVGYIASISDTGVLSFVSAIPEPSTWAAILGAVGLGFAASRRRRAA